MPTICTLAKHTPFDYEGSVERGVTLRFSSGDIPISAKLFRAILRHLHGDVPGGFSFDNPAPGGLGEWVRDHSREFNPRALTPKHASHIAAILVHEGKIRYKLDGAAVVLHFQ
jgi:hypothetical protein